MSLLDTVTPLRRLVSLASVTYAYIYIMYWKILSSKVACVASTTP